ncbi:carbohydrate sulfotransferase 11-like [Patiria miniata]|uniref:Carbohydrate sulfotransferase n=1 Tax=Patiria miniata TaxID=46514 RepID=A0A914BLG6_PATMI|nr:carbohydrate sulfotransferase 11-like [Patiria miniata]
MSDRETRLRLRLRDIGVCRGESHLEPSSREDKQCCGSLSPLRIKSSTGYKPDITWWQVYRPSARIPRRGTREQHQTCILDKTHIQLGVPETNTVAVCQACNQLQVLGIRARIPGGTMYLTSRHIKQLGLVVTGLCMTVFLLLFTYTNQRKIKGAQTDVGHKTAQHRLEGALSILHGTRQTEMNKQSKDEFLAAQAVIQQERLRQVKVGCQTMSNSTQTVASFEDLSKEALTHYIVDDTHRLLYCNIPKVASTSWLRIFLALKGVLANAYDGDQQFVQKDAASSLRLLSSYGRHEMETILRTYTKFVFVRNPFTRILSAFRNKLDPKLSHEGHRLWSGWIKRIKTHIRNGSSSATELTYDLTFPDFVRFVTDRRSMSNRHWTSMVHRCRPCHINYTFIGKIETINADSRSILQLAKIDKLVSFPDAQGSSPTNSSTSKVMASYFADLSVTDIQRLHKRYKWDFKLFGYDTPKYELP